MTLPTEDERSARRGFIDVYAGTRAVAAFRCAVACERPVGLSCFVPGCYIQSGGWALTCYD